MKLPGYSRSSSYNFVIHKMNEKVVYDRKKTDRDGDGGREEMKEEGGRTFCNCSLFPKLFIQAIPYFLNYYLFCWLAKSNMTLITIVNEI